MLIASLPEKRDAPEIAARLAVGWRKVTCGDLTEDQGREIVLGKHGRPKKGEEKGVDGTLNGRGSNAARYIEARLRRDGYVDLAVQVKAKTMSARAAGLDSVTIYAR